MNYSLSAISSRVVVSLVAFALLIESAPTAQAYLGSFEPADGYLLAPIPQAGSNPNSDYSDVTYYNAGQFGANAGGGGPISIAPDSGLWNLLTEPGAFFRNSATRSFYTGTAPPYGPFPSFSGDDVPAYIIGNHSPGHFSPTALALRNETPFSGPPIGGPMEYDYTLDTYDFGGVAPSSVTSGVVTTSFYFCPNPSDPINPGTPARDKFIMSFKDSVNSTGLQIGYAGDNEVYWRPGNSGSWNYTGVIADSANWDGFTVKIDLTNDTFGIDYYDVSTNLTSTLAPTGTALGSSMQDLTHLGWWLTDQVLGGTGGKNFFDSFNFSTQVPEPYSVILALVASCGILVFRNRRK